LKRTLLFLILLFPSLSFAKLSVGISGPDMADIELPCGGRWQGYIRVYNDGDEPAQVHLYSTLDFVMLSTNLVTLNPGGSAKVGVLIIAPDREGIYSGKILARVLGDHNTVIALEVYKNVRVKVFHLFGGVGRGYASKYNMSHPPIARITEEVGRKFTIDDIREMYLSGKIGFWDAFGLLREKGVHWLKAFFLVLWWFLLK